MHTRSESLTTKKNTDKLNKKWNENNKLKERKLRHWILSPSYQDFWLQSCVLQNLQSGTNNNADNQAAAF